jgi:molecular chaperone GrpE
MTPKHETRGPAVGPQSHPDDSRPHTPTEAELPRKSADGGAVPSSDGVSAEPTAGAEHTPPVEEEPASEADHERQLEHDLQQLAAKAEKADAYLQLAQRTKADFENYRRRATRDVAAAQERGIAKLAKELLPAVDNLDRALEAAGDVAPNATDGAPQGDNGTAATLVSGIKLVHADVIAALARAGIERFEPKGERFDPQWHEAIAQQPVEGAESGTVVEVYQRGYRLGEYVIRPARVVVAA